jgi:thiosulfate/3-mercaptopyruvate sulfurtransferase
MPHFTLPRVSRRTFAIATIALVGAVGFGLPNPSIAETTDTSPWILDAAKARELLAGGAILLDTRGQDLKDARPVTGATSVVWQDFTNADLPNKGQLLEDDAVLTEKLRSLGISTAIPVIAIADSANGWGEDGRIIWTLRTLGHENSFLVDGGVDALLADGDVAVTPAALPGDFTVARTAAYEVKKEELVTLIDNPDVVILDTREPREYAGETPYGESRGGHIPGARHIFFKDLVGPDGKIVEGDDLKARLTELGVGETTQVVSYCTGGIRSGFVTAVLNDAGVKARNYAGSMWEWSAQDEASYPLVTTN